jgi:hypothetical protein
VYLPKAHGTLVCRKTPTENHWFSQWFSELWHHVFSLIDGNWCLHLQSKSQTPRDHNLNFHCCENLKSYVSCHLVSRCQFGVDDFLFFFTFEILRAKVLYWDSLMLYKVEFLINTEWKMWGNMVSLLGNFGSCSINVVLYWLQWIHLKCSFCTFFFTCTTLALISWFVACWMFLLQQF